MHMYSHPKAGPKYYPGDIVQHRCLPGVDLVVVTGPEPGLTGNKYRVRIGGRVEIVLEKNLIN